MSEETAAGLVVVTGLPRSGTSLVMRMVQAGGWPVFQDDHRPGDENNPHGYFEHTLARNIWHDRTWLTQARGQAVKLIAPNVRALAQDPFCLLGLEPVKVLLVMRPLDAVMASQRTMLARLGQPFREQDEAALRSALSEALNKTLMDLENASTMKLILLTHGRLFTHQEDQAERIASFLGPLPDLEAPATAAGHVPASSSPPNIAAMAAAVDPALKRSS